MIANKNSLFIFGDNDVKKGRGGQAIIRHLSNTAGIPTKKYPSYSQSAYYTDSEFSLNKEKIDAAIKMIIKMSKDYSIVYIA
ncbi:MAG: hypothetical protein EOO35_00905, partial [Cyanobacteriota bacterium]